ncbi:hybrid sensor histidine kinase/response regulator transcription factor [Dyadobacter alkalitolerans]|uniref:hybrid sensor histidine kinase/response regulator transcription factor n=1 Tax=Dyadobacter alkalitolerans TaxID=492736 RepID=UPI0004203018|nr:response regulator [Dyadobacter alkalitolerans]
MFNFDLVDVKTFLRYIFLLLFSSYGLLAQPFTNRGLSIQEGLPDYYVTGLVQDKVGFIWIATRNGLARYDGRSVKTFRHQPHGNRSLASNIVLSLSPVSDSTILIQLENNGFQWFNPISEEFGNIMSQSELASQPAIMPQVILTADKKYLWGRRANRFIQFEPRSAKFTDYPFPASVTLAKGVTFGNSFAGDTQGSFYAPHPGGLVRFDSRSKRYTQLLNPAIVEHGTVHNYLETPIIRRETGELLIGGVRQLIGYNPQTGRFRSIRFPHAIDTKVGIMHAGVDGNVYFTYGMSVYKLTPDDRITLLWTAGRIDYQNYFHALLVDRSGVLWVGTNGDGVQQLDLHSLPIHTRLYQVNFVHDVLTRELGLPAPNWASSYDIPYRLRWGGSAAYVSARFDDRYNLLRVDHLGHKLQSLLAIADTSKSPEHREGNGLRLMGDGTVWMMNNYQSLLKTDSLGNVLDEFPLPNDKVSDIQPLAKWIWIGSELNGLYAFDPTTRRIMHHLRYKAKDSTSLINNRVWCLAADPNTTYMLWVGTQEGLCRLDTRTMKFKKWTQKQGLPNATIYTLLFDRQGYLWFSSLNGIGRMDPRSGQLRYFTKADGLLDVAFKPFLGVQLPDGRLAFGGLTGMSTFNPAAVKDRPSSPVPTVLTSLKINHVAVEAGQQDSPLTLPLNATTSLHLNPEQNFLSLEFAGLQYNKPSSLRYRYQLVGFDREWVYAGSQNVANYTQLDPGQYEFRVNAADASGRWSPLVKRLHIIMDPPWWQTAWAYGLYVLLLAGLVRAYIRYRINRAELGQQMRLKEQEAQLIKENADWQTRFFTNITHEFRTPLTLIINPLERLLTSQVLPSQSNLQQQYGVMHRNARRMLRLINQLLDLAKLEAGHLGIVKSKGNLSTFFQDLVDSFQLRAERKGITLTYESTGLPADCLFDAQKLETIGYNLLANSLRFTPEGGYIRVSLHKQKSSPEPMFTLQVVDSGVGIATEQLPRIFDRFFQGTDAQVSLGTGTGIGLFLVAELTSLMGGQVHAESQPGSGAAFTVTLPVWESSEDLASLVPVSAQWHSEVVKPAGQPQAEPAGQEAALVLVVEDNEELREFMVQELTHRYRVLTAADGAQGWQLCLTQLPDLVISDVMMPVMDGFQLVERIKTTPLTAHIAVIMLTAKTMSDARIRGLTKGANDYLTKPFNAIELLLRIANLIQHQQQLRQFWQQHSTQLDPAATALPGPVADDPFLLKFYQMLDQQYPNPAYSIEQLADDLAVSQRTLNRKLGALTGSNAVELMRTYRLRKAALFLQQGCSITEAAEKAGFEGLTYFSRSFKAHFDVTPSAYLKAQNRLG